MCTASFRLPCIVTRGRGTWKLNLSHLEDDEYKKSLNEFWYEWQKEKINFHDIGLWWDIGKTFIKRRSIDFSIKKVKRRTDIRNTLTKDIQNERESTAPNKENIKLLISQLRDMDADKQNNIFIRTHNEVIEPGERPSRYFFSQLNTQQKKQEMTSLKNEDGQRLTDQSDILGETVKYYTSLYTAEKN